MFSYGIIKEVMFEFFIEMLFLNGDGYIERACGIVAFIITIPLIPFAFLGDLVLLPVYLVVGLIALALYVADKKKEKRYRNESDNV